MRAEALRANCVQLANEAGLTVLGERFHQFEPQGVTGMVLLAESHLAVHTWPELESVTLDVYVCNYGCDNSERAHALLSLLIDAFAPASVDRQVLHRGGMQPAVAA